MKDKIKKIDFKKLIQAIDTGKTIKIAMNLQGIESLKELADQLNDEQKFKILGFVSLDSVYFLEEFIKEYDSRPKKNMTDGDDDHQMDLLNHFVEDLKLSSNFSQLGAIEVKTPSKLDKTKTASVEDNIKSNKSIEVQEAVKTKKSTSKTLKNLKRRFRDLENSWDIQIEKSQKMAIKLESIKSNIKHGKEFDNFQKKQEFNGIERRIDNLSRQLVISQIFIALIIFLGICLFFDNRQNSILSFKNDNNSNLKIVETVILPPKTAYEFKDNAEQTVSENAFADTTYWVYLDKENPNIFRAKPFVFQIANADTLNIKIGMEFNSIAEFEKKLTSKL